MITNTRKFHLRFDPTEGYFLQVKGGRLVNFASTPHEKFTPESIGKLFYVTFVGGHMSREIIEVKSMIEIEE